MTWTPQYTITPQLLSTIRQIGEEIGFIRAMKLPVVAQVELQTLARQVSTHASTSIEGNPLALTDVRRLLKTKPEHVRDTEREILNYNNALERMQAAVKAGSFTLSLNAIEHIQGQVTEGLMDNPVHVGKLRVDPVIIRDPRRTDAVLFLPPDAKDVRRYVEDLTVFTNDQLGQLDVIVLAGLFHRRHVIIHPFMDGNGRTTRIVTTAILGLGGLDIFDLFAFENFYNRNVTRYFAKVGAFGDFYEQESKLDHTEWLEYFSEGILDELIRVRGQLGQAGPRLEPHHKAILDHVRAQGQITQREYADISKRSLASRKKDLNDLVEWGFLTRHGAGRSVHYKSG